MAYSNYYPAAVPSQGGYMPGYNPAVGYGGAVPDNLAQLRQNQQWGQPMPAQNPQMMAQMPPQTAQEQPMIWVQGDAGARGYMVANGATVVLWDSEQPVIYIKSADVNGVPSMEYLYYTRQKPQPPVPVQDAGAQYITRTEFDAQMAEIRRLMATIPPKQEEATNAD